ncbi:MAG: hypothetical protein R2710_00660 [Acidimicrobiales bacterium]
MRERFGVEVIDDVILEEWLEDRDRTTYLFDVRSPEEYLEAHRPGTGMPPAGSWSRPPTRTSAPEMREWCCSTTTASVRR